MVRWSTIIRKKFRDSDNNVHPCTTIRRELFLAATVRAEAPLCADESRKKEKQNWPSVVRFRSAARLWSPYYAVVVPTIRSIVLQVAERVFLIPSQAYPVYRGTNALEAVCDVLVRGDVTALLAKGNTNLQTSTYLWKKVYPKGARYIQPLYAPGISVIFSQTQSNTRKGEQQIVGLKRKRPARNEMQKMQLPLVTKFSTVRLSMSLGALSYRLVSIDAPSRSDQFTGTEFPDCSKTFWVRARGVFRHELVNYFL